MHPMQIWGKNVNEYVCVYANPHINMYIHIWFQHSGRFICKLVWKVKSRKESIRG